MGFGVFVARTELGKSYSERRSRYDGKTAYSNAGKTERLYVQWLLLLLRQVADLLSCYLRQGKPSDDLP